MWVMGTQLATGSRRASTGAFVCLCKWRSWECLHHLVCCTHRQSGAARHTRGVCWCWQPVIKDRRKDILILRGVSVMIIAARWRFLPNQMQTTWRLLNKTAVKKKKNEASSWRFAATGAQTCITGHSWKKRERKKNPPGNHNELCYVI